MARYKITESRLLKIKERQWHQPLGQNYIPAQLATPSEAPGISSPHILKVPELQRQVHLLSENETRAALLALYNPNVFDLHEQRVLFPGPRESPLKSLARVDGGSPKAFKGTVDVAARLGMLKRHPSVRVFKEGKWIVLPFPYLGDLLLFMDKQRPYLVNWSIKDKESDFRIRRNLKTGQHVASEELNARHQLEELYYNDADVCTHRIAGRDICDHVFWNLRELFLQLDVKIPLTTDQVDEAIEDFRVAINEEKLGYKIIQSWCSKFKITGGSAIALFSQLVWHRKVRIDLFQPISKDQKLRPERVDVLEFYKIWFER